MPGLDAGRICLKRAPPVAESPARVRTAKIWSPAGQWVYTALARDAKMEILDKNEEVV